MVRHRPTLIINAHLVDPEMGREEKGALAIENGLIHEWGHAIDASAKPEGALVIDAKGRVLAPGLIDLRAFVGEPGAEHRESLASASRAAAAGGVTTVICMPDTNPPVDDPAVVDYIIRRARDTAGVRLMPSAALTKGLHGKEMTEFGLLGAAGAVFFTDGARSVANAQVMRRAFTYARDFDALIVHHVEEPTLSIDGVMNEGELSSRLGLPGIPKAAETIMLERDLALVRLTGARYHAAMISCAESLEIVKRAKDEGLPITCGVSINNLALNENDIGSYRTFLKLSPPLRAEDDRRAMIEGVASGLIDVIVSDHNPQDVEAKRQPFIECADGAIGLETMLSVALRLVHNGDVTMSQLFRALSTKPADILGLPQGRLRKGTPADLILFDPDEPFVLDPEKLHSRCKNTPFDGSRLQGRVHMTMVDGRIVQES
ncbi:MAG: dihydroorotase [Alphaproteobacteria bacterium]